MFENVTVKEAIRRGRITVLAPLYFILFGGIVVSIFFSANDATPGIKLYGGMALSFVLSWLYWSVMITRWRLWAFDKVRNVHELQIKAQEAALIWPDGSFFEKTEIRTTAQQQKWRELHARFKTKDVFMEDYFLPDETRIGFSHKTIILYMIIGVALIGAGCYGIWDKEYFSALILGALGILMVCLLIKKLIDNPLMLILNSKGIETKREGFIAWEHISNEHVITVRREYASATYLKYNNAQGKTIQINIVGLNVSTKAIEDMLHTYRIRSKKRKTRV